MAEGPNVTDKSDTASIDTFDVELEYNDEWEEEIKRLKELSEKVKYLHIKCLYCRSPELPISEASHDAWMAIVKNIGTSSGSWRDLGYFLGVPQDDLNYIEFSVGGDKTDILLRTYMQNDTATIDDITRALVKMNRFDVLKFAEEPLLEMCQYFSTGSASTSDAGYHSRGSDSGYTIIKPKNIPNDLPEVLRISSSNQEEEEVVPVSQEADPPVPPPLEPFVIISNNVPTLLLTFAEDGIDFVDKIRDWTKDWSDDDLEVQFLTLSDRKHEVQENPQSVIKDMIDQACYIVPIVTEGYLEKISSKDKTIPSSTDNLDLQYCRYIFTQLMHNYVFVDGCFNKKVRCFLPGSVDRSIVPKLAHYSVLLPWTCEADFKPIFKGLIKLYKKKTIKDVA